MGTVNGVLDLFSAAIVLLLWISLLLQQKYQTSKDSVSFRRLMITSSVMMLLNGVAWLVRMRSPGLFRVLFLLSLLTFFVLLLLYSIYMADLLHLRRNCLIVKINAALCLSVSLLWVVNLFWPFLYDFTNMRFMHPLALAVLIILAVAFLALNLYFLFLNREELGWKQIIMLLPLTVLPLLLSLTMRDWNSELQLLYPLIAFVLLANYVYVNAALLADFTKQQEKLRDLQIRSTTERMKPHYIYNVLTSIYFLCETDPSLAQQAVGIFSDYLRSVLDNLDAGGLISFQQEMQTIHSYLSLEHMRFGDRFHVHYQIQCDDFLLPPFSVQPLVENAVKHGVKTSEHVGEIYIESFETATDYCVVVRDNCGGFDVEQFRQNKGNFGLRYIQKILSMTVGGKLKIESEVGVGTKVTVKIPKLSS